MVRQAALGQRDRLHKVRIVQREHEVQAQDYALPLPGLRQAVQRQAGDGYGILKARLSGMGNRLLLDEHEHQGRIQYETAQRSQGNAENRLVPCAPDPGDLG